MIGAFPPVTAVTSRRDRVNLSSGAESKSKLVMTKIEILNLIARHTREILPGLDAHQFVASDRLVDLGANSVDRAEIAMLVQDSLGLSVFARGNVRARISASWLSCS